MRTRSERSRSSCPDCRAGPVRSLSRSPSLTSGGRWQARKTATAAMIGLIRTLPHTRTCTDTDIERSWPPSVQRSRKTDTARSMPATRNAASLPWAAVRTHRRLAVRRDVYESRADGSGMRCGVSRRVRSANRCTCGDCIARCRATQYLASSRIVEVSDGISGKSVRSNWCS